MKRSAFFTEYFVRLSPVLSAAVITVITVITDTTTFNMLRYADVEYATQGDTQVNGNPGRDQGIYHAARENYSPTRNLGSRGRRCALGIRREARCSNT